MKQGRRGFFKSLFAGSAAAAAAAVVVKAQPAEVAKVAPAELIPPPAPGPRSADNPVAYTSCSIRPFYGTISFFMKLPNTGAR